MQQKHLRTTQVWVIRNMFMQTSMESLQKDMKTKLQDRNDVSNTKMAMMAVERHG